MHDYADAVIVHRDYDGMLPTVRKIPLGCPVYTPRTSRDATSRRILGLPEKAVVMTTIGLLAVWKRIPDTIEALRQALHEDKSLFLQVHAPSPITHHTVVQEEARLRDVLARCPQDRVRFTSNFIDEQDLLDRALRVRRRIRLPRREHAQRVGRDQAVRVLQNAAGDHGLDAQRGPRFWRSTGTNV